MKTKHLLILLIMASSVSAATTTTLVPLNGTMTSYMGDLNAGRPFQAVRNVYTDFMGGMFYGLLFGIFWMGLAVKTRNTFYPTLLMLIGLAAGGNQYLPAELQFYAYFICVVVIGVNLIYKALSPVYVE